MINYFFVKSISRIFREIDFTKKVIYYYITKPSHFNNNAKIY